MPEQDVETRYQRRFGAIDAEIPPTPVFVEHVRRPAAPRRTPVLALGVIVVAAVVVVVAAPLLGLPSILQPLGSQLGSQPARTPNASNPFIPIPQAPFPTEVGELRVISVARAVELLDAGDLEGSAIAVAGYYDAFSMLSCPPPMGYEGPLQDRCYPTAFADTPEGARLCSNETGGCRLPTGVHLSPFLVPEMTPGIASIFAGYDTVDPLPMVLIGHAGDARGLACLPSAQPDCARAFVVDRIAWALAREIPVAAVASTDDQGNDLTPSMSLEAVIASAGVRGELVTAAVFQARDIAAVDPRWPLTGTGLVWLVRTLGEPVATSLTSDPARAETAWLIDDATGRLLDSHPQRLDPESRPALVWQLATVHGVAIGADDIWAFARVETPAGVLFDGRFGGASENLDLITFGGLGSPPLVLPAGDYTITAWLATYLHAEGEPQRECASHLTFAPAEVTAFKADYPEGKPCTIDRAAAPIGDR